MFSQKLNLFLYTHDADNQHHHVSCVKIWRRYSRVLPVFNADACALKIACLPKVFNITVKFHLQTKFQAMNIISLKCFCCVNLSKIWIMTMQPLGLVQTCADMDNFIGWRFIPIFQSTSTRTVLVTTTIWLDKAIEKF